MSRDFQIPFCCPFRHLPCNAWTTFAFPLYTEKVKTKEVSFYSFTELRDNDNVITRQYTVLELLKIKNEKIKLQKFLFRFPFACTYNLFRYSTICLLLFLFPPNLSFFFLSLSLLLSFSSFSLSFHRTACHVSTGGDLKRVSNFCKPLTDFA